MMKILVAFLLGVFFTVAHHYRLDREKDENTKSLRYEPLAIGIQLPIYIIIFYIMNSFYDGLEYTTKTIMNSLIDVMFILSGYYVCLILCMKHLRKTIDARTIATLWVIPNFLYIYFIGTSAIKIDNTNIVLFQ